MIVASIDQVTTEWLTTVLKNSDALNEGTVTGLQLSSGQGNWSSSAVLRIRYSDSASGELPQSVFLKIVDSGASDSDEYFGDSEVVCCSRDYVDVPKAPILRCYDAAFSLNQ